MLSSTIMISTTSHSSASSAAAHLSIKRKKRPRSIPVSPYTTEESLPPPSSSPSSPLSLAHSTILLPVVQQRLHRDSDGPKVGRGHVQDVPLAIREEGGCPSVIRPKLMETLEDSPPSIESETTTTTPLSNRNENVDDDDLPKKRSETSKQETQTLSRSEGTAKEAAIEVRPFRVRIGCIAALRYRPTDIQKVVQILSPSLDKDIHSSADDGKYKDDNWKERRDLYSTGEKGEGSSKNITISPNNTMESYLAPQPGRDEGYALVGKQLRCVFEMKLLRRKKDGDKMLKKYSGTRQIEGEVVTVQTSDVSGDKKRSGIGVQMLVDEHNIVEVKRLNRFKVDDDNTDVTEKEKKKRASEIFYRGDNKVILSVTLADIVPNDSALKGRQKQQTHKSKCLMVHRWAMKKRIPVPGGINKKTKNQTTNERCYIGDRYDQNNQQAHNWRWVAGKHHHPYYTNCVSMGGSFLDPPLLVGKVLETSIKNNTARLHKIFLPEQTKQGRLSHHATNEYFNDTTHKGMSSRDEYEVPLDHLLMINSKSKKVWLGEEIVPSTCMIIRHSYCAEKDVYIPLRKKIKTVTGNNDNNTKTDGPGGAAPDSPKTHMCYRCRKEENVSDMKQCSFETCHGVSKDGKQVGKLWCVDCCRFLRDRGVFTKFQYSNWCCPCCIGVCDCEEYTPCRATQRRQIFFEEMMKANLRQLSEMMSSSEQNNSCSTIQENKTRSQQSCSTCLKQFIKSGTKCMVCSSVTHEECFEWQNTLYQNGIVKKEVAKKEPVVDMEKLSKKERKMRRKEEKREKKRKALKRCYRCLLNDAGGSRSQPQHLNSTSILEPSLTVLNATKNILEMASPIDFDLPFDFIPDVPKVRLDPYTDDSKIKLVEDALDEQEVFPCNSKKVIKDSVSSQSDLTKRPQKEKVHGSKRKRIGPSNSRQLPSRLSAKRIKDGGGIGPKQKIIENVVTVKKETKGTNDDDDDDDDNDDIGWQETCCRIIPYVKKASRNKNNSAAHAARDGASARTSGRNSGTGGSSLPENRRRGLTDESTGEGMSSRAARAKNRIIRRDIALLGKSSLGSTTERLSGCEQSLRFGKSMIHGWGVFTDTGISSGDLIVEYRGVLIGNAVADKREKEYEAAKIGSDYMFRIDKKVVCDATHHGNVARFINASCNPNCHPRILTICGAKRIAIYAKRDIVAGEELCYDYKFESEFDKSKLIPCNCGTPECRGFMNWDKRYVPIPGAVKGKLLPGKNTLNRRRLVGSKIK